VARVDIVVNGRRKKVDTSSQEFAHFIAQNGRGNVSRNGDADEAVESLLNERKKGRVVKVTSKTPPVTFGDDPEVGDKAWAEAGMVRAPAIDGAYTSVPPGLKDEPISVMSHISAKPQKRGDMSVLDADATKKVRYAEGMVSFLTRTNLIQTITPSPKSPSKLVRFEVDDGFSIGFHYHDVVYVSDAQGDAVVTVLDTRWAQAGARPSFTYNKDKKVTLTFESKDYATHGTGFQFTWGVFLFQIWLVEPFDDLEETEINDGEIGSNNGESTFTESTEF